MPEMDLALVPEPDQSESGWKRLHWWFSERVGTTLAAVILAIQVIIWFRDLIVAVRQLFGD